MKKKIYEILRIGNKDEMISRVFDYMLVVVIIINITAMFLETFDELAPFFGVFRALEIVTLIVFIVEYLLRIWTARYLYPNVSETKARLKFIVSFDGIVELFTILPFVYLSGFVVFRMLRVVRIFHLFRVNKYSDSFHVIKTVLLRKKNQILSSVFIVLVLMLASSLTIYSVENEAQPEVFSNAFSGLWWSMSTLLTVGYGDIYPITVIGKTLAMVIELLGVLVVAIPTGIISAGFVEQYSEMQKSSRSRNDALQYIALDIDSAWIGKGTAEIEKSDKISVVYYMRNGHKLPPDENYIAQVGDVIGIYKF